MTDRGNLSHEANLAGYAEYCRATRYRLIPLLW
jgi:hypothetical protein